jgi:hypothetical protein
MRLGWLLVIVLILRLIGDYHGCCRVRLLLPKLDWGKAFGPPPFFFIAVRVLLPALLLPCGPLG